MKGKQVSISLEKRTETAQESIINLLKREADKGVDLGEVSARVVVAIDYSGSMRRLYDNGEVQTTVERVLALSLAGLDDDGDVQLHFFDDKAYKMEEVDKNSYVGFVDKWRKNKGMGMTNYAGTIENIIKEATGGKKKFFGRSSAAGSASLPTFVIFVTDGSPDDKEKTKRLLMDAADKPIFWQFVGLGYSPNFLRELDTMGGRKVDNVGLTEMSAHGNQEDSVWFNQVLEEFVTSWTPAARAAGILR